ncbi:MAG: hypothetical protein MJ237_08510 [bacterium]|nr:hypothetical protein [bacterium]
MTDIQPIEKIDINTIIHHITKDKGCTGRGERIDVLNAIADKAKEYLNDINESDKNIINLADDGDNIVSQINDLSQQIEDLNNKNEQSENSLETTNDQIT